MLLINHSQKGTMLISQTSMRVSLIILVSLLLTSCSPMAVPLRNLDKYLTQELTWSSCSQDLKLEASQQSNLFQNSESDCGKIIVPVTYTDDSKAPEMEVQMMRLKVAAPEDFLGTIFINPGGPGGSGIEQVQWSQFPKELVRHFDIIGFDPRGVGHSGFVDGTKIKCSDKLDYQTYFEGESTPANLEEYESGIVYLDEYFQDCIERNPYWWTVSTANVVSDLDIMREVVTPGEDLNFIGTSYGTTIAGLYISTFPDRVGKIVLDSTTTTNADPIGSALEDDKAMEAKLDIYLEGYANSKGITPEEAWQKLLHFRELGDDDQLIGFAGIKKNPEY